jgi:hypothetical protein
MALGGPRKSRRAYDTETFLDAVRVTPLVPVTVTEIEVEYEEPVKTKQTNAFDAVLSAMPTFWPLDHETLAICMPVTLTLYV